MDQLTAKGTSDQLVQSAIEGDLRKQAWDFFQVHAAQRLTTFNFYIAISSLLSTGLAATFKADIALPGLGLVFGLLLILFSMIFWKLDQRNGTLIKGAERTLMHFEERTGLPDTGGLPHIAKRFSREEAETALLKRSRSWLLWKNNYSYRECFGGVFVIFEVVGGAPEWSPLLSASWATGQARGSMGY